MSSVKNSDNGRTAYVMNLRNRSVTAQHVPHTANSGNEQYLERPPVSQANPLLQSDDDISVSDQIKNALELSFEEELLKSAGLTSDSCDDETYDESPSFDDEQETSPDSFVLYDDEEVLVNIIELLAERSVDQVIRQSGACSCGRCRKAVMASALNELKPQYEVVPVNIINDILDEFALKFGDEVSESLTRASSYIIEHPLHDAE